MPEQPTEKKIIVDEDWKEEAQREKELLAAAIEKEREQSRRPHVPAEASLAVLVSTLATEALIALGDMPNPLTGKQEPQLDLAKFQIDLIDMLQQKTKGNATPEEARLMDSVLFDLRMRFVDKSK